MAGALGGASVGVLIFGVFRGQPHLSLPWGQFVFPLFVAPIVPGLMAFLACTCNHPAPRGWPFVRGGAAGAAYFSSGWVGLFGYDVVGRYAAYASLEAVVLWVVLPLAFLAASTFGVAWLAHRRVLRELGQPDGPHRDSLRRKVYAYHLLAASYAAISIPQAVTIQSRNGAYVLLLVPIPMLLFTLGTAKWFWAAVTRETTRIRRDLFAALLLQSASLVLMEAFAVLVLVDNVMQGRYVWTDPIYGRSISDPTLAVTPVLGLAILGVLAYTLVTEWRGTAPPDRALLPSG